MTPEAVGNVAIGALVMLLSICIIALWQARALWRWAFRQLQGFDDINANSKAGKIKLGAVLRIDGKQEPLLRRSQPAPDVDGLDLDAPVPFAVVPGTLRRNAPFSSIEDALLAETRKVPTIPPDPTPPPIKIPGERRWVDHVATAFACLLALGIIAALVFVK